MPQPQPNESFDSFDLPVSIDETRGALSEETRDRSFVLNEEVGRGLFAINKENIALYARFAAALDSSMPNTPKGVEDQLHAKFQELGAEKFGKYIEELNQRLLRIIENAILKLVEDDLLAITGRRITAEETVLVQKELKKFTNSMFIEFLEGSAAGPMVNNNFSRNPKVSTGVIEKYFPGLYRQIAGKQ